MVSYWRLNGVRLRDDVVVIVARDATVDVDVRQALTDIHDGTQDAQKVGQDLPLKNITFLIRGKGPNKWVKAKEIMDAVLNFETWVLEAPDAATSDITVYQSFKRAALRTRRVGYNDERGTGHITVSVDAIIGGVWIADAGTFYEVKVGYFTKTATGWTRDDGVTFTGAEGPLLQLPEQTANYPKAVRNTDFTLQTPATSGAPVGVVIDGRNVNEQKYDMTLFLNPAPAVNGDVGVYELRSSRTAAYMG